MLLNYALSRVAEQLSLDADALYAFAAEDEIGGFPASVPPFVDWAGGSIWSVEGKFLYAVTRGLQPDHVLECGTKWGCSTSHFLSAVHANGHGIVTSVDKGVDPDITGAGYGSRIPDTLRTNWRFQFPMSAQDFIRQDDTPFDIAYEDTIHQFEETAEILSMMKARHTVKVIISHDICHPWVGNEMRQAWGAVFGAEGGDWQAYCIEPSDCGLAVWRRP
jgi:hypothetical protein